MSPNRPTMPQSRVEYKTPFTRYFGPEDQFQEWMAEPWWKKVLGLTKYDKRQSGALEN